MSLLVLESALSLALPQAVSIASKARNTIDFNTLCKYKIVPPCLIMIIIRDDIFIIEAVLYKDNAYKLDVA